MVVKVAWPYPFSTICSYCETDIEPDTNAFRGWRHVATKAVNCRAKDVAARDAQIGDKSGKLTQ